MFKLPTFGFHIEPTNICTLKCPGCARTRFLDKWSKHWKNHVLDVKVLLDFLDVDLHGQVISLCGNYGDPIYHPDLIDLVSSLKQRGSKIHIITNGSYKSLEWWQDLCRVLDHRDRVVFSIDGIPENFITYRINADWKSIKNGIQTCVDNGIYTVWKFIPFGFNQHCIDDARILSQSLGMNEFFLDPSDRFDEKTVHFLPNSNLLGQRKFAQDNFRENIKGDIEPECYKGKSYFISADGFFSPCCYIADHRFYYKTQFGKQKTNYDIRHKTFSQLMLDFDVNNFYQTLQTAKPDVCIFNCPKID